MAETAQFDRAYSYCEITIKRDEDWRDTVILKKLTAENAVVDFDFSNVSRFDLYIRPTFDHSVLIKRLSSDISISGEIQFSPAVPGQVAIVMARSAVIAGIPIGRWDQFLVATNADGTTDEIWRGPLVVLPGKIT
jgi:hypothetical protein